MNTIVTLPPKTQQVADIIRTEIAALGLKPGTRLLTARQFADKFSVSKHVVQNAFAVLEKEGLVKTRVGCGTFVVTSSAKNSIAIIFDLIYFSDCEHCFADKMVSTLRASACAQGFAPHFYTGRGTTAQEFMDSLSMESSVWREIKGVVAMAWKDGMEKMFAKHGIPLVTLSATHLEKNSIIFDYNSMGHMAATRLLENGPEEIYMICNPEFMINHSNNPVQSFSDELKKHGFNLNHLHIMPIATKQDAGFDIGTKIGTKARHIFFTSENTCAGFARWQEQNGCEVSMTQHIITQASSGLDLGIPDSYDKLTFVFEDICDEALKMLGQLCASSHISSDRIFMAPVLFPRNNIINASTNSH